MLCWLLLERLDECITTCKPLMMTMMTMMMRVVTKCCQPCSTAGSNSDRCLKRLSGALLQALHHGQF